MLKLKRNFETQNRNEELAIEKKGQKRNLVETETETDRQTEKHAENERLGKVKWMKERIRKIVERQRKGNG